jgi:hypothetical protein
LYGKKKEGEGCETGISKFRVYFSNFTLFMDSRRSSHGSPYLREYKHNKDGSEREGEELKLLIERSSSSTGTLLPWR